MDVISNNTLHSWLTLASLTSVSSSQCLEALAHLKLSAAELVTQLPALVKSKQLPDIFLASSQHKITQALQWRDAHFNHSILCYDESDYPDVLRQLSQPPLVLFVVGNPSVLTRNQIAVVGSRNASLQGKNIAQHLCAELVQRQVVITSGLALGIDSTAHQSALNNNGCTVAVVATGPDRIYPKRNQLLHQHIIEAGGAVVSEFFPQTSPLAWHFPKRNRIIAALSVGTLVIEAKIKSGTLITAKLATDLGKEVFAVPGNILQPQSQGCHWLIQQGAKLVTCVDDILCELPFANWEAAETTQNANEKSEVNNLATDKLLDSVDYDITAIDVITERSTLPIQDVMAALLEYELRGLVAAVPGGYIKLRGK